MMKMKLNKKIAGASAMLMLSATMLGTSTFAWFTMNREVTIKGMEVRTHVGSNLLIQKDTLANTALGDEALFVTDETQEIKAILEPVSTVDGKQFFYTLDAKADGSKLHTPIGSGTDKTVNYINYNTTGLGNASGSAYSNKFSEDYGVTKTNTIFSGTSPEKADGYVDYVFQLKATNSDTAAANINLTKLDLTYAGSDATEKAYRAAIFVSDASEVGGTVPNWSSTIDKTAAIYKVTGATNFGGDVAVDSETTRGSVAYVSAETPIASVPAGTVKYYKVVVRLWIEGEDTTCNTSTFKVLNESWKLDLQMELGQGTGVTSITKKSVASGT